MLFVIVYVTMYVFGLCLVPQKTAHSRAKRMKVAVSSDLAFIWALSVPSWPSQGPLTLPPLCSLGVPQMHLAALRTSCSDLLLLVSSAQGTPVGQSWREAGCTGGGPCC